MESNDYRSAERFVTEPPLHGLVGTIDVAILDVARQGMQVEHTEALIPLHSCTLSFAIPQSRRTFTLSGMVVWSGLFRSDRGYTYRSGIHVDRGGESFESALNDLLQAGVARPEPKAAAGETSAPRETRRAAPNVVTPSVSSISPADLIRVHDAAEHLLRSAEDLRRLSRMGRSFLGRGFQLPNGSPADLSVAVWEHLSHTFELRSIADVLDRNDA